MSLLVAMHEKALERMRPRIDALGLDLELVTFDNAGALTVGGAVVAPGNVTVDYVWLTANIHADGHQENVFEQILGWPSVGVLQTYNAGLDHPFYKALSAKGTRVCNSSAQGIAISEYVMAHVMSLVHPIDVQRQRQAKTEWKVTPFRELSQTEWLIIGYGPIGSAIAKRAKAFGAKVSVVRRSPSTSDVVDRAGTMVDVNELARDADIIVLACSLNAHTRGFANKRFFDAAKEGAILVNIARGGLIDDSALLAALDTGRIAHAVLDVFNEEPLPVQHPYWSHPKVRMTAHTSFAGSGVRGRWDELFLENIQRFTRGEALLNEVNPKDLA